MRGIDEETLLAVRKSLAAEGLNTDVIDALISLKVQELNPWLPIDENTPIGKDLLLWCEFGQRIGYIDNHDGLMRAYGLGIVAPTHYQELPDDPGIGDSHD